MFLLTIPKGLHGPRNIKFLQVKLNISLTVLYFCSPKRKAIGFPNHQSLQGVTSSMCGTLKGSPQCRLSILRNGNVACHCHLFSPMSHFEFQKRLCPVSLYFLLPCRISLGPMSHVEFKKCLCHPVDFRGQGSYVSSLSN